MGETWEHASVHWQQGEYQSWANCFKRGMSVANRGPQNLRVTLRRPLLWKRANHSAITHPKWECKTDAIEFHGKKSDAVLQSQYHASCVCIYVCKHVHLKQQTSTMLIKDARETPHYQHVILMHIGCIHIHGSKNKISFIWTYIVLYPTSLKQVNTFGSRSPKIWFQYYFIFNWQRRRQVSIS